MPRRGRLRYSTGQQRESHRYPDVQGTEGRERRGQGVRACGHRHRHREHVVGEERHPGDLRGQEAKVVPGDHVGAARRRVGLDRLPVGQDQEGQHDEQRGRDGNDEAEGRQPHRRDQDPQDLLGGVGGRGQVVGGEDGQSRRLPQPFVDELVRPEGWAEKPVLEPVPQALGQLHGGSGRKRCRRLDLGPGSENPHGPSVNTVVRDNRHSALGVHLNCAPLGLRCSMGRCT